jgi:5-methylcytosine-specific restriction protein A
MSFPEYGDIEEPLLCYILLRGGSQHQVRARDTYEGLADYFRLSPLERKQLRSDRNEPLWNNMIQWARRKLNENGYLALAGHGVWRLSDSGVAAAQRAASKYSEWQS